MHTGRQQEKKRPSTHAGSDPEAAFWLRPVMAVTASEQPFQFRFSKQGMDHIAQNRPGSDLDGLAVTKTPLPDRTPLPDPFGQNQDGLVRVWPNAYGLEASWCAGIIGPGF